MPLTLFNQLQGEVHLDKKRARWMVAVMIALTGLFSIYLYRQSWYPVFDRDPLTINFVFDDGGTIRSPNGKNVLEIAYWDAGASHSGNFVTFVTTKHWLKGRRVLAQGYSSYPVRYGHSAFPVEWVDEDSFWVSFAGHRGNEAHRQFIKIE